MFQNNSANGIDYIKLGNRVVPREFLSSIEGNFQASEGDSTPVEGWNLSTLTYDSIVKSVNPQDAVPTGMFIKADGTKLYMIGDSSNTVFQYSMTTAWDLSSLVYDTKLKSVAGEILTPQGVFFNPEGTIMYVSTNEIALDSIFQYTLSTPWDVSTASYATKSLDVSVEDNAPQSFFISSDGTKVFLIGTTGDAVYQYNLSTPWDISTGTYSTNSLSIVEEDGNMQGIFIKDDGLTMFLVGLDNDKVHQYTFGTAWDLSTATYDSIASSAITQDGIPVALWFNPYGTKMYLLGVVNDAIYQYSLTA